MSRRFAEEPFAPSARRRAEASLIKDMGGYAQVQIEFPEAFLDLFTPKRYKVYYGGRGAAKSWTIARALIVKAHTETHLILCARQFQSSIKDSVHKLLTIQIERLGLSAWFTVTRESIISRITGTVFIFKGIHQHPDEVKSLEGVTICWVEEAHATTKDAWEILIPTIRAEGSEIWVSFNPVDVADPTSKRFLETAWDPSVALIKKVSWRDNPFLSKTLHDERLYMQANDNDAYQHIWEGHYRRISAASVFAGKVRVEGFDTPEGVQFYHGADWGFSSDPTVLIRCFIMNNTLYIDQEAYGLNIEFDAEDQMTLPQLFDEIETSRNWPIKADSARPETISFMRRKGFAIHPAKKWNGSVEDGIAHIRGFKQVVIHERCKHAAEEAYLYSYKVDKSDNVLPIVIDKHNHVWDSVRYALDGFIKSRSTPSIWEKLAS